MSLALLLPLYLAGAAAVAAPVLVHLRQKQTADPYDFSTLRFLLATRLVSSKRRRLLRRFLLSLRVLAILALVFAFARPWFGATPVPADRATVVVVDVSASVRGDRAWADTLGRARRAVDDAGPHTAVVTLGRWPRVVRGFDDDRLTAAAALAAVEPTYEAGDADAALRRAGELLDDVLAEVKEVLVVSDFARPAWSAVRWNQPLPAGVTARALRPAAAHPANLAVGTIEAPRTFHDADAPITVTATVRRLVWAPAARADVASAPRPIALRLTAVAGERTIEAKATASPPPGGAAVASFTITPGAFADLSGEIRVVDAVDGLPADDAAHFTVPVGRPVRLGRLKHAGTDDTFLHTAVRPGPGGGDPPRGAPYVMRPFVADTPFDALVVDHGLALDQATRAAVAAHVEAGSPVLVILGPGSASGDGTWETDLLNVTAGRAGQNTGASAALLAAGAAPDGFGRLDLQHPLLSPFAAPRAGDLFAVRVHRWRAVESPGLRPLIRMPNGDTVLGVTSAGGARVAALGIALDREASTWPIETTFLPVLHQALAWLMGNAETPAPLRVGDTLADGTTADRPGVIDGRVVALHPDESAVEPYELDTFARLNGPPPADQDASPADGSASAQAAGHDTTPWLLLLAAAAAATELWLGNRLSRS